MQFPFPFTLSIYVNLRSSKYFVLWHVFRSQLNHAAFPFSERISTPGDPSIRRGRSLPCFTWFQFRCTWQILAHLSIHWCKCDLICHPHHCKMFHPRRVPTQWFDLIVCGSIWFYVWSSNFHLTDKTLLPERWSIGTYRCRLTLHRHITSEQAEVHVHNIYIDILYILHDVFLLHKVYLVNVD